MRFWERGLFYLWVLFIFSFIQSNLVQAGFWDSLIPVKKQVQNPALNTIKDTRPKMMGVRLDTPQYVSCEHCGGAGGTTQVVQCPADQVLIDFENWVGQYGDCDTDWGGCSNHAIVGANRFRCAAIGMDKLEPASTYATNGSGQSLFGVVESGELDHWGDGCLSFTSMAYGIMGRSGDRVDSFGLLCGTYFRTEYAPQLLSDSPKPTTYQCADESKYGCSPGTGGAEFELRCPANSAITGIKMRVGNDVDAIEGIYCSALKGIYPIFPIDSE